MTPMFINCILVASTMQGNKIIDTGLTRVSVSNPTKVYRCEKVYVDKMKPLRRVVKL